MKRLVIDLDGTITLDDPSREYSEKEPNVEVVSRIKEYRELGYEIIIYSARNMKTYENSVGKINAFTLPVILDWLRRHAIPFDEVYIGKPWCGTDGFYVDDRAIRPAEFVALSSSQIAALLEQKFTPAELHPPTEVERP